MAEEFKGILSDIPEVFGVPRMKPILDTLIQLRRLERLNMDLLSLSLPINHSEFVFELKPLPIPVVPSEENRELLQAFVNSHSSFSEGILDDDLDEEDTPIIVGE
jgi:hypothetical protein